MKKTLISITVALWVIVTLCGCSSDNYFIGKLVDKRQLENKESDFNNKYYYEADFELQDWAVYTMKIYEEDYLNLMLGKSYKVYNKKTTFEEIEVSTENESDNKNIQTE